MYGSVEAFAPRRCLEHALLENDGVWTQDATTLFVDLAGFTRLTDRLGGFGTRGTEELSHLLRAFFGGLTETVTELGGDPVAWGGDALTVVFDGPREPTLLAAADAAHAIDRLVVETEQAATLAGPVRLQTRIGIARGPVTTAVVRSPRRRLILNMGTGLDRAVAAQGKAAAGHVVMHESTVLDPVVVVPGPRKPGEQGQTAGPAADGSTSLAMLAPPVMIDRMLAGGALLETHRAVTVAFAGFRPVGPDDLAGFLKLIGGLLSGVDDLGGEVVQVSGGDKGIVAMVVFGAPVAHADDALRAVQAMVELCKDDGSAAVGLATGPVFAALLGSERRLFPMHTGAAVNVASRLMQLAAPGQILTESATWEATSAHLRRAGSPTLARVKGRADPVLVHQVVGWRRAKPRVRAPSEPPLVGRHREMQEMDRLLTGASAGVGQMLLVQGEAGVGKSRVVRAAIERATTRGFKSVYVDADDHPPGQTSGLWRDLLGGLLAIPASSSRRRWAAALEAQLPEAVGRVGLLGALLDLRLPRGSGTRNLPVDQQAELATGLVSDLIVLTAIDRPLLLVIENVHHLDEKSLDVLTVLNATLAQSRVAILMTSGSASGASRESIDALERRLQLGHLGEEEAAAVAQDMWRDGGGGTAPAWLAGEVRRRAGGNPMFVRAVTQMFQQAWQPGHPPPGEDIIATSLAGLLAERVDRLPVLCRQLLHVLSVAQRPCDMDLVASLTPDVFDVELARKTAEALSAEHLVEIDPGVEVNQCRMLHDVLRRAVYESMSHAERRNLHRRLVSILPDVGADPAEIAEHVRHLDDDALARQWFPRAAASSRRDWNVREAVDWLERVLPLTSGSERDALETELLELLLISGRPDDVLQRASQLAVRSAQPVDAQDPVTTTLASTLTVRRLQAVAEAALACGEYEQSEAAAREAMRLTDGSDEGRHQRAAEILVVARCYRGDVRGGVVAGHALVERATKTGEKPALTTAQAALGSALLMSGQPEAAAEVYRKAVTGSIRTGNVVQQVHVLSDLAGCAFETGQFAECSRLLAQARTLADDIGYRRHLAFNLNNEAQLRAALGDAYSTACAAAAVERSLEFGDPANAANALHTWITAKPTLMADPALWKRLADIDTGLARALAAATDLADMAVAAARCDQLDDARRVAEIAAAAGRELDAASVVRRANFAASLAQLRASRRHSNPAGRERALTQIEELLNDPDAEEIERGEMAVERWRVTRTKADRATAAALVTQAFDLEPSARVRAWLKTLNISADQQSEALPLPVGIGRSRTTRAELESAFARLEGMVDKRHETKDRAHA